MPGELTRVLSCLCRSLCRASKDVRILSELDHHEWNHEEPEAHYSGQCQKVQVANRNQSTDLEIDDDDRIRRARMDYQQE
jgi:hypothetical protein